MEITIIGVAVEEVLIGQNLQVMVVKVVVEARVLLLEIKVLAELVEL